MVLFIHPAIPSSMYQLYLMSQENTCKVNTSRIWGPFSLRTYIFVFLSVFYPRVRPGAVRGSRCTTIRRPQQQQLRRGRLGDVLVSARLSAPGPTGRHVPGWWTAHMECPSAKVCGYVVSRFHSLDVSLKLDQLLQGCIEAPGRLDLGGLIRCQYGIFCCLYIS